jgi:predicted ATP-binding protein involved in virulence
MRLEHLKLTNFRGFPSLEISFDPSLTVLLGGNMAGKTAVLDGAALALSQLLGRTQVLEIDDDEIYQFVVNSGGVPGLQRQFPAIVLARATDADFSDGRATWHLERLNADGGTRLAGDNYTARLVRHRPIGQDLPVIAQYGAKRHWDQKRPAEDLTGIGSRFDGYTGSFDIRSTHSAMAGWIRRQTFVQLQHGSDYVQPQLAAVESAVKTCINDVARFWFDVQYDELRLERTGGDIQSFAMLSEGYRNMVAMIADIAWRSAVLNPHHGTEAHLHAKGVVLIDELDLHLHPAWQRRVVGDLRRTFPQIQFIVTTHSPQIVASVTRAQVRLLDQNRLITEEPHVEGRDTNAILEDVFGVPQRPEAIQTEIDALYRLIEDEDFAAARQQLAVLQERLGPDDAAMIRARWILDTEEAQPATPPSPSA